MKNIGVKRGALISRERVLVQVFILLLGISVAMVYSFGGGHAQEADGQRQATAEPKQEVNNIDSVINDNAQQMVAQGRQIFRHDTFGDEAFWGDTLKLHQAIQGTKFGGVGAGVSPKTALAVGLKVDMDVLPQSLVQQINQGKINLDDPAITLALLKLNSVVGVQGQFNPNGSL